MKVGISNISFPEISMRSEPFFGRRKHPGPMIYYSNGGGCAASPISLPMSRKDIEARESLLHPFASRSQCDDAHDRRIYSEGKDLDLSRTRFARDRDRIIHSRCITLLIGKTQVFPVMFNFTSLTGKEGTSPYLRFNPIRTTRLFHVLGVNQLARSIGRALGLNEDLIEAIALAHDLGHLPFGHAGERAVREIQKIVVGAGDKFRHEFHSLKVVESLEQIEGETFPGLNLTFEAKDGILHHSGVPEQVIVPRETTDFLRMDLDPKAKPATLEGCLVRMMDHVSYAPKDFQDMFNAELISENSPDEVEDALNKAFPVLGKTAREMYRTMVADIVAETSRAFLDGKREIRMSERVFTALQNLRHANQMVIHQALDEFEREEVVTRLLFLYHYYQRTDSAFNFSSFINRLVYMTDETLLNDFDEKRAFEKVGPYPAPDGK